MTAPQLTKQSCTWARWKTCDAILDWWRLRVRSSRLGTGYKNKWRDYNYFPISSKGSIESLAGFLPGFVRFRFINGEPVVTNLFHHSGVSQSSNSSANSLRFGL